jgi:hypothetical protein
VSVSQPVARRWTLIGNVGYNLNQSLAQTATASSSYGGLFVTAGISRMFGRSTNFFVRYSVQRQTTSGSTCSNTVCLSAFNSQQGFIGFSWNTRRLPID